MKRWRTLCRGNVPSDISDDSGYFKKLGILPRLLDEYKAFLKYDGKMYDEKCNEILL